MTVNLPKEKRCFFLSLAVQAFWLDIEGTLPAKEEFEARDMDMKRVNATLSAMRRFVEMGRPVPTTLIEKVRNEPYGIWEIKAPARGERLNRLLAYRPAGTEYYVAYADIKKEQQLPMRWIDIAGDRIRRSLAAGGP